MASNSSDPTSIAFGLSQERDATVDNDALPVFARRAIAELAYLCGFDDVGDAAMEGMDDEITECVSLYDHEVGPLLDRAADATVGRASECVKLIVQQMAINRILIEAAAARIVRAHARKFDA